jgi:hypothetical protein
MEEEGAGAWGANQIKAKPTTTPTHPLPTLRIPTSAPVHTFAGAGRAPHPLAFSLYFGPPQGIPHATAPRRRADTGPGAGFTGAQELKPKLGHALRLF